jgi:lysophospholipase L1-like esterase
MLVLHSDRPRSSPVEKSGPVPANSGKRTRWWLFRIGAVLLGLSVFAVVELVCMAFDLGREADEDPFVGFSNVYPLFVRDQGADNYHIPRSRWRFFAPDEFPAVKQPGTFRIFCLGGSTVQGNPFSKETSFTTWLKLGLNKVAPERNWEVVNCGGISYATYREVPIVKECLGYQPDLFIICTGHNEFLEDRTYEHIKHAPEALKAIAAPVNRSRTVCALRQLLHNLRPENESPKQRRFRMNAETDPFLDHPGGLDVYHRDDEWRAGVIEHFEINVRRMIALAHEARVPVLLMRPTSNLCDCPPFKSQHGDGLTPEQLELWQAHIDEAQAHYRDDLPHAVKMLKQAIAVDDQFAATHYELGKCYETLGMLESARTEFLQARELDICPLRIVAPMEESLFEVARDTGVPFIDAHELLEKLSPSGILGDSQLADHVHPSIPAHQTIATAILSEIQRQGWVTLVDGWQSECQSVWKAHFESLPDLYFLKGKQHLDNLRLWAQGRAEGPPLESRRSASQ